MKYPQELSYTKSHEWVRFTGDDTAEMGLTAFAQHSLGDLVYVELPEVGDETEAGAPFANVESVKAVSEVFCPLTGTVAAVNEELLDAPERINEDPYGAWIARIEGITARAEFLTADAYAEFVESSDA
ncbi:MAG: glycine cleavage system protein GcvH [Christensenellales bacterium]|jgi:glycine cleavage system H protein